MMPRLKLNPLASYGYSCDITVRTTDLNYGGHLGNDRLLSLVHEARVAFLASHGLSELEFGGASLIMGDTAVIYQAEAYAGELLRFEVAAGEPSRSGFRIFYRITRPSDGQAVALVENGMACFDYQARKIVPIPHALTDSGFFGLD
jgi:acyl-CoA thioester hydrolase